MTALQALAFLLFGVLGLRFAPAQASTGRAFSPQNFEANFRVFRLTGCEKVRVLFSIGPDVFLVEIFSRPPVWRW